MRSTSPPAIRGCGLATALWLAAGCTSSPPPEHREGKRPPPPPQLESRERSVAPSPVFRLNDGMTVEQAEEAGLLPAEDEDKSPQGEDQ